MSNSYTINIVITGVGGQGVLTLAEVLAKSVLKESHNVRVGEIHGMAQRGGHVTCTVRIGTNVRGPIIDSASAHLLVGFEPLETLREAHMIKSDGLVLLNTHIQYPVAVSMGEVEYPKHDQIKSDIRKFSNNIVELDAMRLAEDAGSPRSLNMVMLGAILGTSIVPVTKESVIETVRETFSAKFESINLTAIDSGLEHIESLL
ncbi:MAG: indolepyruvate oxidoreductase subunit beta [Candidatus Thorarchaeota archaeon]|jgi:indolepyruvate ferredoxin oxidoreductase beta subunit